VNLLGAQAFDQRLAVPDFIGLAIAPWGTYRAGRIDIAAGVEIALRKRQQAVGDDGLGV
jgi:hypothetical protein